MSDSLAERRYTLGPDHGLLTISTGTAGPAARAGHALTIAATRWDAVLILAGRSGDSSLTLSVDPGSFVVLEGRGGANPLGDDDKLGIATTIREEILGTTPIRFTSTAVQRRDPEGQLSVSGKLELAGISRPIEFGVTLSDDGRLTASATLRQTEFGIKPYSVLFGTLKVADEVSIAADVTVPEAGEPET